MTKFQLTVLGLLAAIAVAVFCLIGLGATLALQGTPPPPAGPAPEKAVASPAETQSAPTSTPVPAASGLADFDKIVTAFEYNHDFTDWDTAPGTDLPLLVANNQAETAYIRIYGNPVQRVQLEIDYSLQHNGAAALINETIWQTIPSDTQRQAVVRWLESGSDAQTAERRFGDRTVSWLAAPDTWLLTVRFND